MQISRIYSNKPDVFTAIDFNCGEKASRLNVIYGEVRHPKDRNKDSHNLGKTTLLHLIDFLMLKGTSREHFLFRHKERFMDFTFFIEIALNAGDFATVRRGVSDPNQIALVRHAEGGKDLSSAPDDAWDHVGLSREEAFRLLDGWLDLRILKPYDYRKAITYFLRSQGDYADELQLGKFQSGRDRDWKPFVAHLFGFNETAIQRKYELDEAIADLKNKQAEQQSEVQFTEDQLPQIVARVAQMQRHVTEIEAQIDAFKFDSEESRLMDDLVNSIESQIAELNERLYNIKYDVQQINIALEQKDKFDLSEIEEIFAESSLHFPELVKKKYEDLVEFNRKITNERNVSLRARKKSLETEQTDLLCRKEALDLERENHLRILRNTDTFEKFKALQKDISQQKSQLFYFEQQRDKVELMASTARMVREAERERGRVVDEIKTMVTKTNPVYARFADVFNSYCQTVLNREGLFFFMVNSNGNFDYQIDLSLQGQTGVPSSQGEGTSYKKIVCALFDLALLKTYEGMPFFHFVYHDGILEALDDRKKLALLEVVREQIRGGKTQYILSLIDSDIPRDSEGKRIEFGADEVVLHLHDDGPSGRLFKMAEF